MCLPCRPPSVHAAATPSVRRHAGSSPASVRRRRRPRSSRKRTLPSAPEPVVRIQKRCRAHSARGDRTRKSPRDKENPKNRKNPENHSVLDRRQPHLHSELLFDGERCGRILLEKRLRVLTSLAHPLAVEREPRAA